MATLVFNDTFINTGASDVALTDHTPDTGTSWTSLWSDSTSYGAVHSSDFLHVSSSISNKGFIEVANYSATSANYYVQFTLTTSSGAGRAIYVFARLTDVDNFYAVGFYTNNTTTAQLYKKVLGAWTELDTAFTCPANGSVCKLQTEGSVISFYDDAVLIKQVTDTDITAVGQAGIGWGGGAELFLSTDYAYASTSHKIDDFSVVEGIVSSASASVSPSRSPSTSLSPSASLSPSSSTSPSPSVGSDTSYFGSETYGSATGASATVNKPANTQDDDLMLAFVHRQYTTDPTTVPDGWTLLGKNIATHGWWLYYKIADTEADNYTWAWDEAAKVKITISIYRYGFNITSPIDNISNTPYVTSDTIVRAASFNVSNTGYSLIYAAAATSTSTKTFTKPTSQDNDWIEDYDGGDTGSDLWHTFGHCNWSGSGMSGDIDIIASGSGTNKHAFAVSLHTAGHSPSPSASASPSLSPSASYSPSVSISPSISPSTSLSPSASYSPSVSTSPSESPSRSPSTSRSPSVSISPSYSPSVSISSSLSPSTSISPSVSISPSYSPSVSISPSYSPSVSISPSRSPSASYSPSSSVSPSPLPFATAPAVTMQTLARIRPPTTTVTAVNATIRKFTPKVEICWNGASWTDESNYVVSITGNIQLSGPLGEASSQECDIELDNTTDRFTPKVSTELSTAYLTSPRVKIRISIDVGNLGYYVRLFTGWIKSLHAPIKTKVCNLHCFDNLKYILNQESPNNEVYTDYRIDQLIEVLLLDAGFDNADADAPHYSLDEATQIVKGAWFDGKKLCNPLINDLTVAERGRSFFDQDGVFRFWNKNRIQSMKKAITLTRDDYLLDFDYEVSETNIKNRVRVTATPRATFGRQQVWSASDPSAVEDPTTEPLCFIPAFTSTGSQGYQNYLIQLEDPVIGWIRPVANTDYTANSADDGSGDPLTDYIQITTFNTYANSAFISVKNTSATDAYMTKFGVRANPIRIYQWIEVVAKDEISIEDYGVKDTEIENNFIDSWTQATNIAYDELNRWKNNYTNFKIKTRGIPYLYAGDILDLEVDTGDYEEYMVNDISYTITPTEYTQDVGLVNKITVPTEQSIETKACIDKDYSTVTAKAYLQTP